MEVNAAQAPATLVVQVPAGAKLFIDDTPSASQAAVRSFVTPPLPTAKEFTYTLKAELIRNGKTLTESKQVTVRGGQETRATIDFPAEGVARR